MFRCVLFVLILSTGCSSNEKPKETLVSQERQFPNDSVSFQTLRRNFPALLDSKGTDIIKSSKVVRHLYNAELGIWVTTRYCKSSTCNSFELVTLQDSNGFIYSIPFTDISNARIVGMSKRNLGEELNELMNSLVEKEVIPKSQKVYAMRWLLLEVLGFQSIAGNTLCQVEEISAFLLQHSRIEDCVPEVRLIEDRMTEFRKNLFRNRLFKIGNIIGWLHIEEGHPSFQILNRHCNDVDCS